MVSSTPAATARRRGASRVRNPTRSATQTQRQEHRPLAREDVAERQLAAAHRQRRRREHAVVEHERAVGEEGREPEQDGHDREHRRVEAPVRRTAAAGDRGSVRRLDPRSSRHGIRTGTRRTGARGSSEVAWYGRLRSDSRGRRDGKSKVLAKHIFVTGGVASSLGKGLTASSLGRLLKSRGPAGHDAEARPVHQRRPRHDEPLPARRGVRHRRRRRDRPRPRPLRALRRRAAHPASRTRPPARSTSRCSPRSARARTSARPCR